MRACPLQNQRRSLFCQRPLTLHFACTRSLAGNDLCGVYMERGEQQGTYTAEGITALCKGLKESTVTSLKCATSSHTPHSTRCCVSAH